jgi:hypothetical protein
MAYQKLKHIKGPMVFFSGYSANEAFGKYQSNLVSAIMATNIPAWLRKYNLPSAKAAQIKDFDLRMAAIIRECIQARHHLRGMVTFPPWLLYFLEQLPKHTNASFSELFPNFGLLITSGMSYTPYRANTERLLGKTYDRLETYPTSEGFIGFTESLHNPGFSLMPANGMFFEFVHLKDVDNPYAKRYCLEEVECACPYAILVTTNAGLMSFLIGDSVEFISVNPPRMIITGRINRVISLVSENVSINDTDSCIHLFSHETNIHVYDYVCAGVHGNTPHYQWIISCDALPDKREILCEALHTCMKKTNTLYKHYSNDTLIGPPEIMWVKRNAFPTFMQQHGELDFQKKVEHICVDTAKFERCKSFMSQHQLNL